MTEKFLPELLAPAGDFSKLRTALLYGANAVYLGGSELNLRAASSGLNRAELFNAVILANRHDAKIYYCLNSYPMPADFPKLPSLIEQAAEAGVHGFIVADPGVLRLVKHYAPHIEIHLSTQANTTNSQAIAFWQEYGVKRVNLARELSRREIEQIRRHSPDIELEAFVHGAMCLAVSGQCLLSAWLNQRPANLGQCTQPCRFDYKALEFAELAVEEATRPGQAMWRVREEKNFSSFWAPSDLCLMPFLPWFVQQRIDALKIEGRGKSSAYLAHVVDAYASALKQMPGPWLPDNYLRELPVTRPLSSGFFLPDERIDISAQYGHLFNNSAVVLAEVTEPVKPGVWLVEVRGRWQTDQPVELMLPGLLRPKVVSYVLENQRGQVCQVAHGGTRGLFYCEHPDITPGIFIRQRYVLDSGREPLHLP